MLSRFLAAFLIHQLPLKPLLKWEAQGGWKITRAMESDEEQCLRGLRMLWRYSPVVSWERYHDNNLKELEYVFQNFNFNHITIFKSPYSWVQLIRIHAYVALSLSLCLLDTSGKVSDPHHAITVRESRILSRVQLLDIYFLLKKDTVAYCRIMHI